jgi:hypothetical protein
LHDLVTFEFGQFSSVQIWSVQIKSVLRGLARHGTVCSERHVFAQLSRLQAQLRYIYFVVSFSRFFVVSSLVPQFLVLKVPDFNFDWLFRILGRPLDSLAWLVACEF